MEERHYTPDEIKNILRKYYDLPGMISAEVLAVRELSDSMNEGVPSQSSRNWAHEEAQRHLKRASGLATQKRFLDDALFKMDRREKRVLQLRFMGPSEPDQRKKGFHIPPWKIISQVVGLSQTTVRGIARDVIKRLSTLPVEPVIFE